jgi:hypothetical protein
MDDAGAGLEGSNATLLRSYWATAYQSTHWPDMKGEAITERTAHQSRRRQRRIWLGRLDAAPFGNNHI